MYCSMPEKEVRIKPGFAYCRVWVKLWGLSHLWTSRHASYFFNRNVKIWNQFTLQKIYPGCLTFANFTGFQWGGKHITVSDCLKILSLVNERYFFKLYSQFISPAQPMERSELYMFWRLLFLVWLKGTIRSILLVLKPYSREHLSLVCLEEQQLLPSSCLVILKLHTVSLLSAEPVWTTN